MPFPRELFGNFEEVVSTFKKTKKKPNNNISGKFAKSESNLIRIFFFFFLQVKVISMPYFLNIHEVNTASLKLLLGQ